MEPFEQLNVETAMLFGVTDDRISAVYLVRNPDKLTGVPSFPAAPATAAAWFSKCTPINRERVMPEQ